MKHVSLASKYRPQTFADVAGQDMIKAVLSRAAAEDQVAPGYLLCGTRGVGKTTIARIFAKALNCEHSPAPEPCNECEQCRKITAGIHPDVVEIDGASNNSVDDARALRENIGYAPMEGRYRVFIIDEAHMLSRQAFNALLKTLEEPPAHVTFIFATTEVHKFLPTILSRCQVFSFHHLPEQTLANHLTKILEKESIPFDPDAVQLIARRGAGSARDSMSLLDQVLAFGPERLDVETVRKVLGMAGLESYGQLFSALAASDCAGAAAFCRSLASTEVDMGFFVRELVSHLRSLFLMRQCGENSLVQLGASNNEIAFWKEVAPKFTPTYLHAAWQMVLDAQRGLTTSQEPAAVLELLLVNLAMLPLLLPTALAGQTGTPEAATAGARPRPTPAPAE